MSTFSVVATPIGNLEDITLRALRVLKGADVIACEDTRVTKKLLSHFDIHTPVITYQGGEKARPNDRGPSVGRGFAKIIELLEAGKHVVLVSDAGTPGLSDPGLELVSVLRARLPGLIIEAIPGPSALAAAISIAGLRAASFTFYGFLPLKKGREKLLKEMAQSQRASVFYESPHRVVKALTTLQDLLPTERRIGIFRELTKMYEEAKIGSVREVLAHVTHDPQKQRGEFVIIIEAL